MSRGATLCYKVTGTVRGLPAPCSLSTRSFDAICGTHIYRPTPFTPSKRITTTTVSHSAHTALPELSAEGLSSPFGTRDTDYTQDQWDTLHRVYPMLSDALRNKYLHVVSSSWSTLVQHRLVGLIRRRHWSEISLLIDALDGEIPYNSENTQEMLMLDELAAHAAAVGHSLGLIARMHYYVINKDSDRVIRCFTKAFKLHRQRDSFFREQAALSDTGYQQLRISIGNRNQLPPIVIGYVITATAMKNSFTDALRIVLHPNVLRSLKFDGPSLQQSIKTTTDDPILLARARRYGRRILLARIFSLPLEGFRRHVERTSYAPGSDLHTRFIDSISAELLENRPFMALHSPLLSTSCPILVDENSERWAIITRAAIKYKRFQSAERLRSSLERAYSKVPLGVWAATLEGFADLKDFEQLWTTWSMLHASKQTDNAVLQRALIFSLLRQNLSNEAMDAFEQLRTLVEKGVFSSQKSAVLSIYDLVLEHLVQTSELSKARAVLERMQTHGPQPTVATFNIFVEHFARTGKLESLEAMLNEMGTAGLAANFETYSWLLVGLRAKSNDAVEQVFQRMERNGIQLTGFETERMIKYLTGPDKKEDAFAAAIDLLNHFDTDKESDNTHVREGSLVWVQCAIERRVWLDPAVEASFRKHIARIAQAHHRPLYSRSLGCLDLLRACFENPTPQATQRAWQYYEDYCADPRRDAHGPPEGVDGVLLNGLRVRGEWKLADKLVDRISRRMEKNGTRLSSTVTILIELVRSRNSDTTGALDV